MIDATSVSETSQRPLAYVETVLSINPIPGADAIEVLRIKGWNVVSLKNVHKVGDRVVYFEIDSLLPPWQCFIEDKLDKCNFRIKTIKLRGQVSQGYCLPLGLLATNPNRKVQFKNEPNEVPYLLEENGNKIILDVGTDLTEFIGVKKYELPSSLNVGGRDADPFPGFLQKTEQTRIQNKPNYPEKYANVDFEVTEKLDGTSITAFYYQGEYGVCSRNLRLADPECLAIRTLEKLQIYKKLAELKQEVALQGELIGPGIQGNIYKLEEHTWRLFDVFIIPDHRCASPQERVEILRKLGLQELMVPVLGIKKISGQTVDQILISAEGTSVLFKKQQREGVVYKSMEPVDGKVRHFKAISNAYELKRQ